MNGCCGWAWTWIGSKNNLDLYTSMVMYFSLDAEGGWLPSTTHWSAPWVTSATNWPSVCIRNCWRPSPVGMEDRSRANNKQDILSADEMEITVAHQGRRDFGCLDSECPGVQRRGKGSNSSQTTPEHSGRNRLAKELRTRGDELERTNDRLRQINAELEDFTHVVSHDLKEPLRTLRSL